jgi:predicted aspartyl protease
MGVTVLTVEIAQVGRSDVWESLEFIVDSGSVYSVVPAPVLERLGILPIKQDRFRLANGTHIVRRRGAALFRFGEYIGGADVIFGEEGDATLLGALTLESLGLALDPIRRELKPMELIL